jgi:hypothetical protein
MLKKLETFALLLAALLALAVEGAFVYWMRLYPLGPQGPDPSLLHVGSWMSSTLPKSWLIGSLLALFYYLIVILRPPAELEPEKLLHHRQTFLRIWCWFMALAGAQSCVLYLNYFEVLHR